MGNPLFSAGPGVVSNFYRASSWIEGAATKQVGDVSALAGVTALAAFPDLHPGKFGPVGIAVDVEGLVYPTLIGTDIGCGVALASTDIDAHKLKLERVSERLAAQLEVVDFDDVMFEVPLGSIGGGNHFCELTAVKTVLDADAAHAAGLEKGRLQILVHTGSRSLGASVFERYQAEHGVRPLAGDAATAYLNRHDQALAFARANRLRVIERTAAAVRGEFNLVSDVAHNFITEEDGTLRHRKGASTVRQGLCVVLGSRGSLSYVVAPTEGVGAALASLAHGAGRKLDRATARAKFGGKGVLEREHKNPFGGRIICNDKSLSAEEAAGAYKSIEQVIGDLESFGLIKVVATLQPVITFKTAGGGK